MIRTPLFPTGHATHPEWRMAAALVLAQLQAQMALPTYASAPTLGLLYITDHYASHAQDVLDYLTAELPGVADWCGTVGIGVAACGAEYFDEPALSVMLLDIAPDQYRVFSGVAPLPRQPVSGFVPHTALVHADGHTPDLPDLLAEVASRTTTGYVFGGVSASRNGGVQFAVSGNGNVAGQGAAAGVFDGGLSGVAFGAGVSVLSRITQGCQPIGAIHTITSAVDNVVLTLDGEPALDVLLDTLGVSLENDTEDAIEQVTATLAGLVDAATPLPGHRTPGHFGVETLVRPIVGLDGNRMGVALGQKIETGMRLTFCQRHLSAARADLTRICAEIREELAPDDALNGMDTANWGLQKSPYVLPDSATSGNTATGDSQADDSHPSPSPSAPANKPTPAPAPGMDNLYMANMNRKAPKPTQVHSTMHLPQATSTILGAIYISCAGRGGPHFGGLNAELQLVRHALGDVPLVGFFAGGEIAHQYLYGYAGVLTVFTAPSV